MLPSAGKKDALQERLLQGSRPVIKRPQTTPYLAPPSPVLEEVYVPPRMDDYGIGAMEGSVSAEQREMRKKTWEEFAQNYNTVEAAKQSNSDYVAAVNARGEEEHANYVFSANLIDRTLGAYVPYYSTGIHDAILRVEITGTSLDPAMIWKPEDPVKAFGSYTKYEQGTEVPIALQKSGKLANTYLIRSEIGSIISEFPFSIGVEIGHYGSLGEGQVASGFVPWSGKKYYCNNGIKEFHYVIPPYYRGDGLLPIYRSTAEVNNEYGLEYTYLTDDYKSVTKDVKYVDDMVIVPVNSPLLRWLYMESNVLDTELGTEYKDKEGYRKITKPVFNKAVRAIQDRVRSMLPVRDFGNFRVQFTPLMDSPVSQFCMKKAEFLRDKEYETKFGQVPRASEARDEMLKNKATYFLICDLHFLIMFRDQAPPSVFTQSSFPS